MTTSAHPSGDPLRREIGDGAQTLDDLRRAEQRNLLSSPGHPRHDLFAQARICLDREELGRGHGAAQCDNLAAALALEAFRNRQGIDHVAASRDGARLFAVEGELESPAHRISQVETAQAAAQSVQRSSELFAQLAREREAVEQRQAAEREREQERERQHGNERSAPATPEAAAPQLPGRGALQRD